LCILVVLGVFLMFSSILGVYSIVYQTRCLLFFYALITLVIMVGELGGGIYILIKYKIFGSDLATILESMTSSAKNGTSSDNLSTDPIIFPEECYEYMLAAGSVLLVLGLMSLFMIMAVLYKAAKTPNPILKKKPKEDQKNDDTMVEMGSPVD
jgi:hypothetical protein